MRQVTFIYVVLHFRAKVLGNVNGIFSGKGDGKNFHKLVVILVAFLGWLAIKLFFPVLLVTAFWPVGDGHFDQPGFQSRLEVVLLE